MQVHPAIAALRTEPALQRRAQSHMVAARETWLASEIAQRVQSDLLQYSQGAELSRLPVLSNLMMEQVTAQRFVQSQNDIFISALRREPLGEVPFRQTSSAGYARSQLLEAGSATLSLCIYEPTQQTQKPSCVQFVDCEVYELVLAGAARGQSHQLIAKGEQFALTTKLHNWRCGDMITGSASCNARQILQVQETLLVLQLTRSPVRPQPSVELSLPEGKWIREVSGDKWASEQVMALGVLGALADVCVLDAITDFARDTTNDDNARWEAVRQSLSLDSAQGMALLSGLAESLDDPLSKPSQALFDQLLCEFPCLCAASKGTA